MLSTAAILPQLKSKLRHLFQEASTLTQKVIFNSPELAAFHEAGHAEVALAVGARVIQIELYREAPRSFGRTRVERDPVQSKHIALGGFAAEYRLYRLGRLRKLDGAAPSEKEFIDYALNNAREDMTSFFENDLAGSDGFWPTKADSQFMSYAIGRADKNMRWMVVQAIAERLLSLDKLNEAEILDIFISVTSQR